MCVYSIASKPHKLTLFLYSSSQKDIRPPLLRQNVFAFQPFPSAAVLHRFNYWFNDLSLRNGRARTQNFDLPAFFLLWTSLLPERDHGFNGAYVMLLGIVVSAGASSVCTLIETFAPAALLLITEDSFMCALKWRGGGRGRCHKPEQVAGSGRILWIECTRQ